MIFSNKIEIVDRLLIVLFTFYPLAILLGNFSINFFIITIGSLFIIKILTHYKELSIDRITFYLLIFFFLSLCVNLIFSQNINLSYPRVVKFIFIIFFVISFNFLLTNYDQNMKNIFKTWFFLFLLVIIDLAIEFIFGKNILGQNAAMPGRLGSFTGIESTIGGFFLGFCLIFLSFIHNKKKNIKLNLFIATILIIVSFVIGERANFIRTFLAIIFFLFLAFKFSYKIKILLIFLIFSLIFLTFSSLNANYKERYLNQLKIIFVQKSLTKFLENSNYGAHRNVANKIFIDNPIFGIGIKNFRNESANKMYDNLDHNKNHLRVSTHPHELYYEFLSETGLFGLICFLLFILSSIILSIKNYLRKKNLYQLSAIIFVIVSILPVLPQGAFLSTFTSSIFWINYAIMVGYNNVSKVKS
jgi:O-antigen ligase